MVRHACSTVVWSRLPKASPISGRLIWVRSLASAMATWRGRARLRLRFLECMSDTLNTDLTAVEIEDVAQCFLCEVERELAFGEAREGEDFLQCTLEFAHVRADMLGNEKGDVLR